MARRAISSRKTKPKSQRMSKTQQRNLTQRYYGDEPLISDSEMTQSQLSHAYNYYNATFETKDRIVWLTDYLLKIGRTKDSNAIKNMSWRWVNLTACSIARLMDRGAIMPDQTIDNFNRFVKETLAKSNVHEETDEVVIEFKPRNIQNHIKDKTSDIIGEIEGMLDDMTEVNFRSFIIEQNVTSVIARRVIEKFEPQIKELTQVLDKSSDVDLLEGYKKVNKKLIKQQLAFLNDLVEQFSTLIENKKRERKPRKKKAITTDKKLKHFVWMKQSNEYNITSIQPANIIGASELWTFNTKYNVLTVFRGTGLEVKRRYITNYDEKTSMSKKIGRKTKERLMEVLNGTKPQLRKVMDNINVDPCKMQDMIGENTLLLRVAK